MKRKLLPVVLSGAMSVSLLMAGCGSSGGSTGSTDTASKSASSTAASSSEASSSSVSENVETTATSEESVAANSVTSSSGQTPGAKDPTGIKGKRIGISLVYKGDEWCAAVADEFENQAKDLGVEVNIQDGNLDAETQTKQIENFIAQDYDMIFIDPANADGVVPALKKATDAGIPIVLFDAQANYDDVVSYVSWDNYKTGEVIGSYLHDKIKDEMDGKASIVLLTMANPVTIGQRIDGVKAALKDLDITYVAEQEYEGNREKAANVIQNIKEPFDFVVAGQDNGAQGAAAALKDLNKTDVQAYSMGGYGEEAFDTIKADNSAYKGTVVVSPANLVKSTYGVAKDYWDGKSVDKRINIDLELCTKDNVDDYLK